MWSLILFWTVSLRAVRRTPTLATFLLPMCLSSVRSLYVFLMAAGLDTPPLRLWLTRYVRIASWVPKFRRINLMIEATLLHQREVSQPICCDMGFCLFALHPKSTKIKKGSKGDTSILQPTLMAAVPVCQCTSISTILTQRNMWEPLTFTISSHWVTLWLKKKCCLVVSGSLLRWGAISKPTTACRLSPRVQPLSSSWVPEPRLCVDEPSYL